MNNESVIFIGGLHRSGTSLIHHIFRAHPDATGFQDTGVPKDEGQHLQTVYNPAKVYGGPGKFAFDPASHMDETHPLVTPENATELLRQWKQHWDISKSFWFEKSPPNLIRTRFLQALFPNARFIMILRHPLAVAYATQKWSKTTTASLIEHNLICYERLYRDLPHLKHAYVIRYEEFVQQPQAMLATLLEWLGMAPFDPGFEIKTAINQKYFEMYSRELRSFWKGRRLQRAIKDKDFERRANHCGYSILQPEQLVEINWLGPGPGTAG